MVSSMTKREDIARVAYPDLWAAIDREEKRVAKSGAMFAIRLRKEKFASLGLADRLLAKYDIIEKESINHPK